MSLLEKSVEQKCCDYALGAGVPNDKFVTPGKRGASDRIFWIDGGKPLIVEFKKFDGKKSPQQKSFIKKLEKRNYTVFVCYSIGDFAEVFDAIMDPPSVSKTRR